MEQTQHKQHTQQLCAEVVVHYEIMNSHVPFVCIQADWYRHVMQASDNWTASGPGKVSSLGMILKETLPVLAGIGGCIFDGESDG